MLTIGTTLTIFLMLGISSLSLFLAKRLNFPHTVLLVLIGVGLGFLSMNPSFSFINEFKLTPELLFYLLLPTLIFESAYHMDIRKLVADSSAVLSLAIGSFLVSAFLVAGILHFLLLLIGIDIPFIITLLFGALISATDPVAVLALFKEYGVPKRLSLIFEGESLFNDATAVAFFLIILGAIGHGGITIFTSLTGLLTFLSMLVMGVLFGLFVGGIFAYLVGAVRESEVASITLTIVLAHITFILAEVISEVELFGMFSLHISPIISTTVASLLMGNYGRPKMNPEAEAIVGTLWEQFAFLANSLIFILIGVLIVEAPIFEPIMLVVVVISIITVAIARALSIYPVISIYNFIQKKERRIPSSWQHLLAWGSLRGALAVTMVLLIPDSLTVPGWSLDISPKDFLLSITVGCIAATLFIKATTIRKMVRHFKLDSLTAMEEIEYQEAQALIHHKINEHITLYKERGYIDTDIAEKLISEHASEFRKASKQVGVLSQEKRNDLAFRILRIFAIGIEKRNLKELYHRNEVSEFVFRRIQGKLRLQLEAIEDGDLDPDVTIHVDGRDIFERFFSSIKSLLGHREKNQSYDDLYMYYRAQAIVSRKVLKELHLLNKACSTIFTSGAVGHVNNLYTSFKKNSLQKLHNLSKEDPIEAKKLAEALAVRGVHSIEETVLNDIYHKELITQKLYISIKEELSK